MPEIIIALTFGFILDLIIGDPHWMPHPIRLFGNAISLGERKLNKGNNRFVKGALLTLVLVAIAWLVFYYTEWFVKDYYYAHLAFLTVFVFFGLANRCLIHEVLLVERKLTNEGLDAGRKQLSYIVGRDTKTLTENKIRTAMLETLSENLSDGVIAPLFYFALGGIPLMFSYKMVNTLDSMLGYKNDRYKDFGKFAARLDDVFNFIPARITALLMVVVTLSPRAVKFVFKYGHKHASPNSGYPESALAGILNCRFGGPNVYHGVLVEKPYIGNNERIIEKKDVLKACAVNIFSSLLFVVILVVVLCLK